MKSKSLSLPSKDDTVIYTLKPEGDWHEAKVTGRGGKAMGLHSSWFNVKSTTSDKQYSTDFENVIGNFVIIPKSCQHTPKCDKAKQSELEKLKNFNACTEVIDEGQFRISTTWVSHEKNNEVYKTSHQGLRGDNNNSKQFTYYLKKCYETLKVLFSHLCITPIENKN